MDSQLGALWVWILHLSPCLQGFPPTSPRCAHELNWCVYVVPLSVNVGVCEWPWGGRVPCPTLHPELLGQAPANTPLN